MDERWNGEYKYDYGYGSKAADSSVTEYGTVRDSMYGATDAYAGSGAYNGEGNYSGDSTYSETYSGNGAYSETAYHGDSGVKGTDAHYGNKMTRDTEGINPGTDRINKSETAKVKHNKTKTTVGQKIAKTAAYGLVFGIVAGSAFGGVSYGISKLTGGKEVTEETASTDNSKGVAVQTTSTASNTSGTLNYDVAEIAAKAKTSIVSINTVTKKTVQYFFQSYEQESKGAGSGIVIGQTDDVLYISTNYHVIEGASTITVGFSDGSLIEADVRGYDSDYDIAVLEVKKTDISEDTMNAITVAAVGDSDTIQVGEPAIAMGNPLGIGQSVTVGYISALSRTISDYSGNFIQTDAAINPGNSGGALLNGKGEVIGVTSSKYVDSSVEGMGFAIPINKAMELINDIINGKRSLYIGITGVDITSDYSAVYGLPEGIYIKNIEGGSPAEKDGLMAGDIISYVDNEDVTTMEELSRLIKSHEAGDEITLGVYRQNYGGRYELTEVTVTLEEGQVKINEEDTTEE
ncbi:MAG: trypsin-like peptidase domain-containing protein [Eubacterium sp.]|nr:trypsin-like peptidase domain-containing protein [Eubacterium sp.]